MLFAISAGDYTALPFIGPDMAENLEFRVVLFYQFHNAP
jgi:hypothetical protein